MTRSTRSLRLPAATLIAAVHVAALSLAASAGTVTFDPDDGYFLGTSIVDNFTLSPDDPDWVGSGQNFSITSLGTDGEGVANGGAQSAATNQTNFSNVRFTPSATFLGLDSTATTGQLDFSFDLRNDRPASADLDDNPENDFGLAHRIRLGGTDSAPIIQFQIFDNGRLQYNDGGSSLNTLNVNAVPLDLDDLELRFITVEGTIDFDTGLYDLTVDGVEQGSGLGLINDPDQFGQVTLQWGPSNSAPDYRQITLDNLTLEKAVHVINGLAGDYDDSGLVEQGDLNLVLNNWGAPAPFDPNGDPFDTGTVDQEELNRVLNNWGSSNAPSLSSAAVPEPASLALLSVLGLAGLRRR
ncbi:MAG: PEP-CTERM sorting domain-containing protein [Planctomycetota bacterium]